MRRQAPVGIGSDPVLPCGDPMRDFGSFACAARFCSAFDEPRQYFRVRLRGEGHVSLGGSDDSYPLAGVR